MVTSAAKERASLALPRVITADLCCIDLLAQVELVCLRGLFPSTFDLAFLVDVMLGADAFLGSLGRPQVTRINFRHGILTI